MSGYPDPLLGTFVEMVSLTLCTTVGLLISHPVVRQCKVCVCYDAEEAAGDEGDVHRHQPGEGGGGGGVTVSKQRRFCLVVVLDTVPRLTETYPALSSSAPKTEDE